MNWALARSNGWALFLRMEDLDSARVAAAAADVRADLAWLGIDHDGAEWVQSARVPEYASAMRALAERGLVYQSPHSRSEVREAAAALSAPHGTGEAAGASEPSAAGTSAAGARAFPASLRPAPGAAWSFVRMDVNHRFRVGPKPVHVTDQLQGERTFHPALTDGDFIVWTKSGYPAYQLAVVVDDMAQGVTDVVRGADLLPSAALQSLLYQELGAPPPRWWHLPLVLDARGERLAKRRDSLSLGALRAAGTDPRRVVGMVAWWAGIHAQLQPTEPAEFRAALTPSMLRAWCGRAVQHPPTLTPQLLDWLHQC